MSKVTWLHISDWHQKGENFDRLVVRDLLMKDVSERAAINPDLAKLDFIIFSDDLAYHGKTQEYDFAIRYFFTPLLEAAGLGDSSRERPFIVPGNHDVDRSAFDVLPDNLIEKLSTPVIGYSFGDDYMNKLFAQALTATQQRNLLIVDLRPEALKDNFVVKYSVNESQVKIWRGSAADFLREELSLSFLADYLPSSDETPF